MGVEDRIERAGFFHEVGNAYQEAARAAGVEIERVVTIAGQRLGLRFAGPGLVNEIIPALAPLEDGRLAGVPPSVRIWDSASTGVPLPPVSWRPRDFDGPAEVRVRIGERVWAFIDPTTGTTTVVDGIAKCAYLCAAGVPLPWYQRAAPLRSALHWLLMGPRRRLVHGAAVSAAGGGAMLVGGGGSGKTTLALACMESGLECLGDDYVVVAIDEPPLAHRVYATAKPSADSLARLPGLRDRIAYPALREDEKAVIDLRRSGRVAEVTPVRAVVVPRLSQGEPARLRRASAATALLALGPSTIFQHPGREAETMEMMAELVRRVPSYVVDVGPDPAVAAGAIVRLLDDAS